MYSIKHLAAAALLVLGSAVATAAPTEIRVGSNANYKHKSTKIVFPPSIGALERGRIVALDAGDLDVAVDYRSADEGDVTTVFLFRNTSGSVPVWFDRATKVIEQSTDKYGTVTPTVRAAAFVPSGQSTWSGLRSVYATSGPYFSSTAIAIVPVGDFYVKMRLSSATLTPAQIEAQLTETLSAIRWPGKMPSHPAAIPVAECGSPLVFAGEAKPAPADGAAALLSALLQSVADSLAKAKVGDPAPPTRWCRDSRVLDNAGLYRPDGTSNRYLIAIQDAGRALVVGENRLASLVADGGEDGAKPRYGVELVLLQENQGFGDFESLPPPEQAVRLMEEKEPLYRSSTLGSKNQITLSEGALTDQ